MKRRNFLKGFATLGAAAVVAPVIAAEVFKEIKEDNPLGLTDGIFGQIQRDYLKVQDQFRIGTRYEYWVSANPNDQDHSLIHFTTEIKNQIWKDKFHVKGPFRDISNKVLNQFAEKFYKFVKYESSISGDVWFNKAEADQMIAFQKYREMQMFRI